MTVATWLGGFGVNVGRAYIEQQQLGEHHQLHSSRSAGDLELPWPSWFTQCESVKKTNGHISAMIFARRYPIPFWWSP
jgi:hypothetical protein